MTPARRIPSQREAAHSVAGLTARFAQAQPCAMIGRAAAVSTAGVTVKSHHGHPSLDRSARFAGGPVSRLSPDMGGNRTVIGYHSNSAIELGAISVDSGAIFQKPSKGRIPCRRNQSSSPSSRLSHFPLVWKAILNAPSLVLVAVWSRLKSWARIVPARCWQVPPSAYSVTTSAFAHKHVANRTALAKAYIENCRRRGFAPAAVLRFGGDN
jgi:hypothetical protein